MNDGKLHAIDNMVQNGQYISLVMRLQIMEKGKLLDVSHVSSRGTSFRVTLPRKIVKRLALEDGDILAFYEDNGVKLQKLE